MQTTDKQSSSLLRKMLYVAIALFVAVALVLAIQIGTGSSIFAGSRPDNLGVREGRLALCPSSPNCVSSYNQDAEHGIAPLTYNSAPEEAMANLKTVINSLERTNIVEETDDYLYAEFSSKLMGFVDDVEFYLDPEANVIQVRSASRLGESDLGVNRQRIETIRAKFNEE
jgi:uncharacterized protein (DUF1499 family)